MNVVLIGVALLVIYVLFNEYRWFDLARYFRDHRRKVPEPVAPPLPVVPTVTPPVAAPPMTPRDWEKVRAAVAAPAMVPVAVQGASHPLYQNVATPTRRVLTREALDGIFLETRHFMLTKGADRMPTPNQMTYEDIKKLYRAKAPITIEQIQSALDHHRALVQDTAITAATLSGEHWAGTKLMPFTSGEGAPGNGMWEARNAHEKAMRHMSKLVYWYAKLQAGVLYETTGGSAGAPTPFSAASLDGEDEHAEADEDDDFEEDEEDDDGDDD